MALYQSGCWLTACITGSVETGPPPAGWAGTVYWISFKWMCLLVEYGWQMATVLPRKTVIDWNLREEKWTRRHEGSISESDGDSGASRCFVFVDGERDERRQSGFITETLQQTLWDIQCFPPDGLMRNNKSPLCFCLRQHIFLNSLLFFCLSSPPSCLSVLCAASTVAITLLTDAGLWATQHHCISASLFAHSDTHIHSKTLPFIAVLSHTPLFWEKAPCKAGDLAYFPFLV